MSFITFHFRHGHSQTWPSAKHSTSFASSLKEPSSLQDLCYMPVRNGWCRGLLRLSWWGAVWQGAGGWGHDHPFPTLCGSPQPRELEGSSFKLWQCVQKNFAKQVQTTRPLTSMCKRITFFMTDRWYSALSQIRTRACASDSAFRANVVSFLMARLV